METCRLLVFLLSIQLFGCTMRELPASYIEAEFIQLTNSSMIDRLFAMWQALYPNSYVEPQSQLLSNFWYTAGDVLDVNTRK
jgi:hypothetical protein